MMCQPPDTGVGEGELREAEYEDRIAAEKDRADRLKANWQKEADARREDIARADKAEAMLELAWDERRKPSIASSFTVWRSLLEADLARRNEDKP